MALLLFVEKTALVHPDAKPAIATVIKTSLNPMPTPLKSRITHTLDDPKKFSILNFIVPGATN